MYPGMAKVAREEGFEDIADWFEILAARLERGACAACGTPIAGRFGETVGHFGRRPIRLAWFCVVLPSLLVNYYGQGALLLSDATATENPFFRMAPEALLYPLVALATAAAVIASQATISGAFSMAQQAALLGLSPRVQIQHTSASEFGQIYVPAINWMQLAGVVALASLQVAFQSVDGSAAAGEDYTETTGTLAFEPGESVKTVAIPLEDDLEQTGNRSFVFRLANPSDAFIAERLKKLAVSGESHRRAPGTSRNSSIESEWNLSAPSSAVRNAATSASGNASTVMAPGATD